MSLAVSQFADWAWPQFWQTTVVAAVALLLARGLRSRQPHLAYVALLLVFVKCLTPPVWSSPLGVFSWGLAHDAAVQQAAMETSIQYTATNTAPAAVDFEPGNSSYLSAEDPLVTVTETTATPKTNKRISANALLFCAWAVGVVVYAAFVGFATVRHWRAIRAASDPATGPLADWHAELARKLRIKRPVRLWISTRQHGPSCFGVVFPVIVLPEKMVRGASRASIEPVLAHELIHIRRGDTLVGMVQVLAGVIWWFHPLIWLASRELTQLRERCCDVEVVGTIGCAPAAYAQSMLNVLKFRRAARAAMFTRGIHAADLTQSRLESIMNRRGKLYGRTPWFCWFGLLAGIVLIAPGSPYVSSAPAQPAVQGERAAEDKPELTEFLDPQQRDYVDCESLPEALAVLKTKLAEMGLQRYEAMFTEDSVRAAVETSIDGFEAENRRHVTDAPDAQATAYARRTADFFQNVASPLYQKIAKDGGWPRGAYFHVSAAAEPGQPLSVNLQLDTRHLELADDQAQLSPRGGRTVGHAIPLVQVEYGFRDPQAQLGALSLNVEFDDSVNADDSTTVAKDFFAVPVTTDLQKRLLGGPEVVAYVNVNASSIIDAESMTVDTQSDVLPAIRGAMKKLSEGRAGGRLRVAIDYGTLRTFPRLQSLVQDLFRGIALNSGFPQVDVYGSHFNDDGYQRKGFDRDVNEGDLDERVHTVGNVRIYPVNTALGRYLAGDFGCYIDVGGPVPLDARNIFPPTDVPTIERTIADLKLGKKRVARVNVQVAEPQVPYESVELPQAKKYSYFHRDAVVLLKKAGFDEVRIDVQYRLGIISSRYDSAARFDQPGANDGRGPAEGRLQPRQNDASDPSDNVETGANQRGSTRIRELGGRVDVTTSPQGGQSISVTFNKGDLTDEQLDVLEPVANLESLYVYSSNVTDAGVAKLAKLQSLRKLQLLTPRVTDTGLAELKTLTELRRFVLMSQNVTSDGFAHLKNFTKLVELKILATPIDNAGLAHLKALGELQRVELSGTNITDDGLQHLKSLPKLKWLTLSFNTKMRGEGLEHLKQQNNLKSLSLLYQQIDDVWLRNVGELTELEELSIIDNAIPEAELAHLKSLKSLRKLNLPIQQLGDHGVAQLAGLTNLESLTLAGTDVSDAGMAAVARMTQLRQLGIGATQVSDEGLRLVGRLASLRSLGLNSCPNVTDAGIAHLKELRNLESLTLAGTKVADAGLKHVGQLTNLRMLNVANTPVGDEGARHLDRLVLLEAIDLGKTKIGDATLAELKNCPRLQVIELPDSRVTDAGVETLSSLPILRKLNIAGVEVSDRGLANLQKADTLKALVLSEGVAERAAAELKKALPDLNVVRIPKPPTDGATSSEFSGDLNWFYLPVPEFDPVGRE